MEDGIGGDQKTHTPANCFPDSQTQKLVLKTF